MPRARRSVEKELQVLSRSGFLTKRLWRKHLFEGGTENWMHHAWAHLFREPYFAKHPNPNLSNVLVFNRQNRTALMKFGREVARAPHEGILLHDEVVLSGVLQIESHGFLDQWELEAGLKSRGTSAYRIETQGSLLKYPDAVLSFRGPKRTVIAVEVELTQKDRRRYDQIINCYSFMKGAGLVLFVVENSAIEAAIRRSAKESFYPTYGLQIGFMNLKGWEENPLLADVEVRGQRRSLGSWLDERERQSGPKLNRTQIEQ